MKFSASLMLLFLIYCIKILAFTFKSERKLMSFFIAPEEAEAASSIFK